MDAVEEVQVGEEGILDEAADLAHGIWRKISCVITTCSIDWKKGGVFANAAVISACRSCSAAASCSCW